MNSPRKLILGTAGHIDHGKTALVRALTGVDTDRLPQEKQRGITIDVGFAELDLGDIVLGIVDVPGHERFIRNMLAGASGIDLALVVVAADDSVMPQTREHLAILQFLDIKAGVIALTKCDVAEEGWIDLVEEEVRELTRETCLADAPIVRTSSVAGDGMDTLREALHAISARVDEESLDHPFRMAVDRSFAVQGIGTVVTGSVSQGMLSIDDSVEWLPRGEHVRVRSLQNHGRSVNRIHRGERAAVNLIGVHHRDIVRGHEIAAPGTVMPVRSATVSISVLESAPWPVQHRARVRFHIGTQEVIASVRLLNDTRLEPGESGFGEIIAHDTIIATGGQPFVIRAESPLATLGGGHVLRTIGRRPKRRNEIDGQYVKELASTDIARRIEALVYFCDRAGASMEALRRDAGGSKHEVESALETALSGTVVALDDDTLRWVHVCVLERIGEAITRIVAAFHRDAPLEPGVPRSRLAQRFHALDERVFDASLNMLLEGGVVRSERSFIALPKFAPKLDERQKKLYRAIVGEFEQTRLQPPGPGELADARGVPARDIEPLVQLAVHEGDLVHLGAGLYLHARYEKHLRETMINALRKSDGLAMREIRDLLDTTRKYAVPMCDYLDSIGITRRVGDLRILAQPAEKDGERVTT